jgi:nucleoside-diphosphate-sugar epimerase
MTIFLAGAAGAVGRPLSQFLVAEGHRVVGTTRSREKAAWLAMIGVEPVVVDVYDAEQLKQAVIDARPSAVIHQLTDLPAVYDPATFSAALVRNARVRDEGTRNLVAAAVAAGAARLIAQSIAFSISDTLKAFERQVLDAPLEGIVLRYGQFYGPGTWTDVPPKDPPTLHVEAAAEAARTAVTNLAPGLYVVTDADGIVPESSARQR